MSYERCQGRRSNRFGGWLRGVTEKYAKQIRYIDIDGIMRNGQKIAFAFEIKELDEISFEEMKIKYWKVATKEQHKLLFKLSQLLAIPAYLIWMKDEATWIPPIKYKNPWKCKYCGCINPQPAFAAKDPSFRVFQIVDENQYNLKQIGIFSANEFIEFILNH